MKTERRHELQTNELADIIGTKTEAWKPYIKWIIAASVIGVVALFCVAMMRGNAQGKKEAAWTEYFAAAELQDLEGLRQLATKFKGTEAAAWSLQSAGDIEAATGARDLFINKNDARERLMAAQEAYSQAAAASKEPILLQRAHMGLAQVYESLGEFDNAISEYNLVSERWSDSALANEAADRRRVLEDPATVQFANWFAKYEPPEKEALDQVLGGGAGIKPPSPSDDLPDMPELSLPSADELARPAGLEISPPEKGSDSEASGDAGTDDTEPNSDSEAMDAADGLDDEQPVETSDASVETSDGGDAAEAPVEQDSTESDENDAGTPPQN